MRTIALVTILAIGSSAVLAGSSVNGYVRKDGTYVAPHYQTAPNASKYDNYSSQGNINPFTGQRGAERNEFSNPSATNRKNPSYNAYDNDNDGVPNGYDRKPNTKDAW